MGTSVLHIKTEVECHVYLFDEEKGIAKPGTYFNLEVRKGEQDLLFVSTEDEVVVCFKSYNVEDSDCDYRMTLEQSQFINVDIEATKEEVSLGVKDEFGVVYSNDGLQLLKCPNGYNIKEYHIQDGCKVIRGMAFGHFEELTAITLPDSLTHIGAESFSGCKHLISINLPAGLTHIGFWAFGYCEKLTAITLPANLTHIGDHAFCECENLTAITLPANLTHIGDYTFCECENLTSITLPTSLTYIGDNAFEDCHNLTSITLPIGLTHIREAAFSGCINLTTINLPAGLTHIEDCAFSCCYNLFAITLPASLTHIGDYAFCECEILTTITLPDALTHIGTEAFRGCKHLTNITLPANLTYIGNGAFYDCRRIITIKIPNGITHIGSATFSECISLTSIILPTSLTHIGDGAFSGCEKLTAITLPASLTHIGNRAFDLCKKLTSITLPASLAQIGDGAFSRTGIRNVVSHLSNITFSDGYLIDQQDHLLLAYLSDKDKVSLPTGLTHIGNDAFSGCKTLTTIILPTGLTHIGDGAFALCENLTSITLPSSLTHIGDSAFSGCEKLIAITLPSSLTHIGNSAFWGCKKFTAIILPDSLTYIENYAFSHCENLTTITLPDSLAHIGHHAFWKCKNLTTITLPASLKHIEYSAFSECYCLSHIFIPAGMRKHFKELLPKELHDLIKEKKQVDGTTRIIRSRGVPDLINPDLIKGIKLIDNTMPSYYLFFDTETTGVPRDYNAPASNTRNWPRLVQLGWIVTDEEGNVLSQGNEIVKPEGFVIPADAARVHGITTEKAQREGKPLREVIEAFLKDAEQAECIVGHNISFDQKVVGAELHRLGIPDTISTAKSLCTMQAGTDYCKIPGYYGYKWPKLQELHYKLFGCDFEDAHDAMADITATKKCFFEMRKRGLI